MGVGRREKWKLCGIKEEHLPAKSHVALTVYQNVAVQTGAQTVIDKQSTGRKLDQNCLTAQTPC